MNPAAWNKMYLKELFIKNDIIFPFGKWYEDLGTTPKLTLLYPYSIVKEPLYNYVQNTSSIMHTYDNRIFDIYEVIEGLEQYLKEKNLEDKKYDNIEFINIYHILIGTIYRASFHKEFNPKMINDIYNYVLGKYPNWFNNKYIKNLPFIYRLFLKCLKIKAYFIIYLNLKIFGKYMSI
jgi:hypothetical protein